MKPGGSHAVFNMQNTTFPLGELCPKGMLLRAEYSEKTTRNAIYAIRVFI